ncbi:MAG: response regulator transcription factor [Methylobacter sp.]
MKIKAEIIDHANLTQRESEVLALICEAAPDKIIARRLAISISTVNVHIDNIYKKLEVRADCINSRSAAISAAVINGMVRLYKDRRRVSRDVLPPLQS